MLMWMGQYISPTDLENPHFRDNMHSICLHKRVYTHGKRYGDPQKKDQKSYKGSVIYNSLGILNEHTKIICDNIGPVLA